MDRYTETVRQMGRHTETETDRVKVNIDVRLFVFCWRPSVSVPLVPVSSHCRACLANLVKLLLGVNYKKRGDKRQRRDLNRS